MIKGNLIDLQLVREHDAQFIIDVRNDEDLSQYISETNVNVNQQQEWIKNYLIREQKQEEFYFIVINKELNIPCGTVRIYEVKENQATWGSFILNSQRPDKSSYEVIKLSLDFAFNTLGLWNIYLEVNKDNKKAIYIYEKVGFIRYDEDNVNYHYKMNRGKFNETI